MRWTGSSLRFRTIHDPHDALREAFGDGAETINSRFRDYILGGDFYEVSAPVEPAPLAGPIAASDPAMVASILGRLEASTDHLDTARSHAEEGIRLAPNDAMPREVLALADYLAHNMRGCGATAGRPSGWARGRGGRGLRTPR